MLSFALALLLYKSVTPTLPLMHDDDVQARVQMNAACEHFCARLTWFVLTWWVGVVRGWALYAS